MAQHPGLANPDISKIICEQWRDQPDEVKNSWKLLAEDEKARHQRQYPDYRYRPRRGGKGASARPATAEGEDPGCCPKCGGRYIATPRTPSSPIVNLTAAKGGVPPAPYVNPNPRVIESDHLRRPSGHGASMSSAHGHRRPLGHGGHHGIELYDAASPTSPGYEPDPKRRRYDDRAGHYYSPTSPYVPYAHQQPQHRPQSLSGQGSGAPTRYQTLPTPAALYHSSLPMGPPPRPSFNFAHQPHHHSHHGAPAQGSRGGGFDESLRLPPLQTQTAGPQATDAGPSGGESSRAAGLGITTAPPPPHAHQGAQQAHHGRQHSHGLAAGTAAAAAAAREERDAAALRSIEAMVMSIPYLNKLKVLSKISPPLAPPAPGSPAVEVRGPVVAIEGRDAALVAAVGALLERVLAATGEHAVRVWRDGPAATPPGRDDEDGRDGGESEGETDADADGEADSDGAVRPASQRGAPSSPFGAYLNAITAWHARSDEIVKHVTSYPASGADGDKRPAARPTPVALLAGGFSLTLSDRFACSIPIADSYAPVDHWQWMATLWRGVVGPDLVVYVRACRVDECMQQGSLEHRGPGIIVVRVPLGQGVDEATLRRLGLAVLEWIRAGFLQHGAHRGGFSH